jgi:nucleotide-binding universal stress UspA family protein
MLTHLCGYDATEPSLQALEMARAMARAVGAKLIAVTVAVVPDSWHEPEFAHAASVRTESEGIATALRAEGTACEVIEASSAARGLHDAAMRHDAALVTIGVEHRGPLARIRPGTVAHHLLHGMPSAVLVVPPAGAQPVRTVGVGYDGTPESESALRVAAALAADLGAALRVLTVFDARPYEGLGTASVAYAADPNLAEQGAAVMRRTAEDAAASCQVPGGVSVEVLEGAPGRALVEAAHDGVDLLVAGSRSFGPLRAVLAGSVSHHLAEHAPCPVLLVPRGGLPIGTGHEAG